MLYICLIPLLYSLFLACYQAFDWTEFFGVSMPFARINSYIYAHSYGALLMMLFVGIKIGLLLSTKQPTSEIVLYLMLALTAWASFKSFADLHGMLFLIFGWVSFTLIGIIKHQTITKFYRQKHMALLSASATFILLLITIINEWT